MASCLHHRCPMCDAIRAAVPLLMTTTLSACASAQMPSAELTEAKSAVRAARAVGVEDAPKARLHLEKANNAIERAKAFVDEDNENEARNALARAESDAELALALAEENRVRKELQQAQKTIQKLKKQLEGEARS